MDALISKAAAAIKLLL